MHYKNKLLQLDTLIINLALSFLNELNKNHNSYGSYLSLIYICDICMIEKMY